MRGATRITVRLGQGCRRRLRHEMLDLASGIGEGGVGLRSGKGQVALQSDDLATKVLAPRFQPLNVRCDLPLGFVDKQRCPLPGVGQHGLCLFLGRRHDGVRFALRRLHETGGLLPTFLNRQVCRTLSQSQRAAERLVSVALRWALLGPGRPLAGVTQPLLEDLDPRRHALEELVDIVLVVAPKALTKLNRANGLGGNIHGRGWYRRDGRR